MAPKRDDSGRFVKNTPARKPASTTRKHEADKPGVKKSPPAKAPPWSSQNKPIKPGKGKKGGR